MVLEQLANEIADRTHHNANMSRVWQSALNNCKRMYVGTSCRIVKDHSTFSRGDIVKVNDVIWEKHDKDGEDLTLVTEKGHIEVYRVRPMSPYFYNLYSGCIHIAGERIADEEETATYVDRTEGNETGGVMRSYVAPFSQRAICGQILYRDAYYPLRMYRGKKQHVCGDCSNASQ